MNTTNNHLSISAFGCFAAALVLVAIIVASFPSFAQDTAIQTWEYGALVYSGEDAFVFTDDLETNHALNEVLSAMTDDEMSIVAAMNVMGAEGWEYLATQDAGAGSSLYLFKRPRG